MYAGRGYVVLLACVALLCASCGSAAQGPERKPVVKVSGKVLVDGKPVKGISVSFHPVLSAGGAANTESGAQTDENGKFQMMTYTPGDGVPKGDYAVTFELTTRPSDPDRLNNLYNDPKTSEFKVTVADKALALEPYDLKVEGVPPKELTKKISARDLKKMKRKQKAQGQ